MKNLREEIKKIILKKCTHFLFEKLNRQLRILDVCGNVQENKSHQISFLVGRQNYRL